MARVALAGGQGDPCPVGQREQLAPRRPGRAIEGAGLEPAVLDELAHASPALGDAEPRQPPEPLQDLVGSRELHRSVVDEPDDGIPIARWLAVS